MDTTPTLNKSHGPDVGPTTDIASGAPMPVMSSPQTHETHSNMSMGDDHAVHDAVMESENSQGCSAGKTTLPDTTTTSTASAIVPAPSPSKGLVVSVKEDDGSDRCGNEDLFAFIPNESGTKEKMIAQVLQRGKILKISQRLRTRLEYAVLKIRRGWSKYTLQEVESLVLQPTLSPAPRTTRTHTRTRTPTGNRLTHRRVRSSITPSNFSPALNIRQSGRQRTRKELPNYEPYPDLAYWQGRYRTEGQNQDPGEDQDLGQDLDLKQEYGREQDRATSRQPTRFSSKSARPSLSEFKDSELFLPAKSLMDIAASSSPSPSVSPRPYYAQPHLHGQAQDASSGYGHEYGFGGPLYRDPTPTASSIHSSSWSFHSMPSSPILSTSPTMRYMWDEGGGEDEVDGPSDAQAARTILLLASSPTRSPDRTLNPEALAAMARMATAKDPWISSQGSGASTAVPYLPMTSSPLVRFQTVSSTTSAADFNDDDANPFLVQKKRMTKGSSSSSSLSAVSTQTPAHVLYSAYTAEGEEEEGQQRQEDDVRAITPDMEGMMSAVTATPHTPQRAQEDGPIGIQTPPPSGSQVTSRSNPGLLFHPGHALSPSRLGEQSIAARRRSSGLTGGPGMDLLTMFPIPGPLPDETK